MNVVVLLLLLFLLLFGFGGWSEYPGGMSEQACAVSTEGVERCGPELIDGRYQIPAEGVVTEVRVNNGPVAPDSQAGYELSIDADGTATITEMPMGASDDLSDAERSAEQTVRTEEIGEAGLQSLLTDLETCGFYYLPQRDEVDPSELPDGGSISVLAVTLADGEWESFNQAILDGGESAQFDACQALVAERFAIDWDH